MGAVLPNSLNGGRYQFPTSKRHSIALLSLSAIYVSTICFTGPVHEWFLSEGLVALGQCMSGFSQRDWWPFYRMAYFLCGCAHCLSLFVLLMPDTCSTHQIELKSEKGHKFETT
jgi:hypothetical protein